LPSVFLKRAKREKGSQETFLTQEQRAEAQDDELKFSGEEIMAKKNGSDNPMDAISLLKADHRKVEGLFEEFEKAKTPAQKEKVARKVCIELIVHATIEEELFYPAVRGKIEDDDLDEAYVEHDGAKLMITELLNGAPGDDFYDAKFKVLSEDIKHHVKEEERRGDGIFAQAKDAGVDLDALGEKLAARKKQLMAQIEKSGPPTPETRTLHNPKLKQGQPVSAAVV
jgi:hypothetical protein